MGRVGGKEEAIICAISAIFFLKKCCKSADYRCTISDVMAQSLHKQFSLSVISIEKNKLGPNTYFLNLDCILVKLTSSEITQHVVGISSNVLYHEGNFGVRLGESGALWPF